MFKRHTRAGTRETRLDLMVLNEARLDTLIPLLVAFIVRFPNEG